MLKNDQKCLVKNLKDTRQDCLGLFLEKLLEKGYKIILKDTDFLSVEKKEKGAKKGVVAFGELEEFKGKGVSGKRLFFNLSDEWDKYQQSPIALPAPANQFEVEFALKAIENLKPELLRETEKEVWEYNV